MNDCPFCDVPEGRILRQNKHAILFLDLYPVNPGHALVVPNRHVASPLNLYEEELEDMIILADIYTNVMKDRGADGFNIGFNVGIAAGQTVMHAHMHIIPRYRNDQSDPRGGIRRIFPEKAAYWNPIP